MALDRTTEFVAHFIGAFQIAEDEARMRETTDGFRRAPDPQTDYDPRAPGETLLRAPYSPEGYDPGLTPFRFPHAPAGGVAGAPAHADGWTAPQVPVHLAVPQGARLPSWFEAPPAPPPPVTFAPPPPSQIAVVAHQANALVDHDVIAMGDTVDFAPPEVHHATLTGMVGAARAMSPDPGGSPVEMAGTATTLGAATAAGFDGAATAAVGLGGTATVLTGTAATGGIVDGAAVETAPPLAELMPGHHQPADTGAPETPATDALAPGGSAQGAAATFDVPEGHAVVAGGNLALNETLIAVRPVDAPVIAVMGDAVSMTAVSQVNVIRDVDTGAPGTVPSPSVAINAADISAVSSVPDDAPAPPDTLPVGWGVTRIEGDLVAVAWVDQYNFVSDHDRTEITFSGQDTRIITGDNVAFDQVSLTALSQSYDLIVVGGRMIDLTTIGQTNVLLDDDAVTYSGDWPPAVSLDDNLAYNGASIASVGVDVQGALGADLAAAGAAFADGATTLSADVAQDDMFYGTPYLSVLYISGDLIQITSITQTNIVGDADQVHLALDGFDADAASSVTVTTGSNALVNIASILEFGLDSTVMVGGEAYDDLLLYQASLIDADADPLGVAQQAPLANEAVAFLADDMIEADASFDAPIAAQIDATGAASDVMGAVTA